MSDGEDPCRVCQKADDEENLILCDGCDAPYHIYCHHGCVCCQQKPRIHFNKVYSIPEGDWYCKFCSNRLPPLKKPYLTSLFAWGDNSDGQLGLGTDEEVYDTPTAVNQVNSVSIRDISLGETSSILLTYDDEVYTCGTGTSGQLGHQDVIHEKLTHFRKIEGLDKRAAIEGSLSRVYSGRDFSALVTQFGHIYTWGNGEAGQLGHQDNKSLKKPKKVSALREQELPVVLAAAGSDFMVMTTGVAKEEDYFHRALPGVLMTMGSNAQGQLGEGSTKNQWVPQLLNPDGPDFTSEAGCSEEDPHSCLLGRDIVSLSVGSTHVALSVEGTLGAWSWGFGESGQLGHPKPPVASASKFFRQIIRVQRPRYIQALSKVHVTQVACGASHTLFLTKDHRVYGCGNNKYGQLGGDETTEEIEEPKDLELTSPAFRELSAGENHSMGLTKDGIVYAWGANDKGQLGLGHRNTTYEPMKVSNLPKCQQIHSRYNSTFAIEFTTPIAPKAAAAPKKGRGRPPSGGATKKAKK